MTAEKSAESWVGLWAVQRAVLKVEKMAAC
jgi:hypothetical protein